MTYAYDANGIAQRDFGRAIDFKNWVVAQTKRVREHFPNAIAKLGELGPLVFSRWATDDPDLIVGKLYAGLTDLVAVRVSLDLAFPITQLEAVDADSRMVAQWNVAPRAVFDRADELHRGPITRVDAASTGLAVELVAFGTHAALGLSDDFAIARDGAPPRFSGFCPVCDGVQRTTTTRIDDPTTGRALWEEQCLRCARRSVVWKAAWYATPA
jgi:hypothetical protein